MCFMANTIILIMIVMIIIMIMIVIIIMMMIIVCWRGPGGSRCARPACAGRPRAEASPPAPAI